MSQNARDLLLQHLQQRRDNGETAVFLEPQLAARLQAESARGEGAGQGSARRSPERESAPSSSPAENRRSLSARVAAEEPEPAAHRAEDRDSRREKLFAPTPGSRTLNLSQLKDELAGEPEPPRPPHRGQQAPNAPRPRKPASEGTPAAPAPAPVASTPQPAPVPPPNLTGTAEDFFALGKIPGDRDDPKVQALHEIYGRVLKFAAEKPMPTLRDTMVFATGNPHARLMFVGEAPGSDEEKQREPFVGRAGELLTKMIRAMKVDRSDVYISNIVKFRPRMPDGKETGNRKPSPDEIGAYRQFVLEEIRVIKPHAIVALGATSAEGLLQIDTPLRDARGKWHDLEDTGCPVMVTYHPAYLLRNASNDAKRVVWEDLLQVMERLQMPISQKQRNWFL